MRERGVQSRRARDGKEPVRRPGPTSNGTNIWQVVAIIALLAATAGWTTVAVIALRPETPATALASPTESDDPGALDGGSDSAAPESHDAPELEADLPTTINGATLHVESQTGTDNLSDDGYSNTIKTFLTSVGKAPADLHIARAIDPDGTVDGEFQVYRVAGVDGKKVGDTLIDAWKVDFPDLTKTDETISGQPVTKVVFDPDTPTSYLYVRGEDLYDIWTSDPAVAAAAIAALPAAGGSGAPRASGSAAPSARTPAASSSTAP
ncbi:MAG: hypothetical protein ACJ779_08205 [Chloroflexota bacterium]